MVRAPVSLVLALTLLFAALSSATTPTLATAAKLAARRAALLRELELVEIDLKAVSLDIDVNSSTCSLDTCDEEKGIVNQDEEDRQEKKEMEVAEDVEKSLPVATANLTLADIMKENIFLRSRERKAKLDASLPPWYEDHQGGKTHGLLHLFYATPVYRTNINLVKGEGTSQRINNPLVDKVMNMYLDLVHRGQEADNVLHNGGAASYNEINNEFFNEQDNEGENFLEGTPEMGELKAFMRECLEHYWRSVPGAVGHSLLDDYGDDFFYWAAVSHWGVDHQPHVHFESVLSGVYYLKTPPMSGSFELHDPRGFPKYPFEHHHSIKPVEGDLLLFPGWLPHGVLPTYGPEPRIAIAFNLQAPAEAWLETTNAFDIKIIEKRE